MNRKRILHLASVALMLAASFCCNFSWAQPVVKVPATCKVVVAGSGVGTVLGAGGVVGSGGVVIMPDPFQLASPAGDFTYIPNGTTQIGWGMQGDLSVLTGTTSGAAIQGSGPSATLNIQSYNENLRIPSENTLPSTPNLGRSKGRISVSYSSPGCGGGAGISFDVYKTYDNTGASAQYVPPIIGPDCWLTGTTYTYSVDQMLSDNLPDAIGLDKYYWSIADASSATVAVSTAYFSADKSSYTFTTPSSFSLLNFPLSIKTCYGRANPWDGDVITTHSTCVTHAVVSAPTAPNLSTAIPTCLATGVHTFSTTYVPVAGQTYTWTSSNASWTLTQSPGSLSITTMDDNPGVLTLTITGPCLPAVFTYNVNRSLASAVTTISGATCVSAGTANSYTLTSPDPVLNNGTCWTLPSGWTKTNLNGAASSVSISVPAGTPAGSYTVSANSCLCPGGVISLTVNVKPAVPGSITGPVCVVRNGGPTASYSVTAIPGAASYTWNIPSGWSCVSGCALNSAVLQPGGTSAGPVSISVTANGTGGCNSNPSAAIAVNYSPITPAAITNTCFSYGVAGTTFVTVGSAPSPFFGTYTVTSAPSGLFSGTPGVSGTGVISLNTLATASGTYVLFITHVTSCGSSSTTAYSVTVAGNGSTLTLIPNPSVGGSDVYIASASGTPTYTWSIAGSPVPGATNSALLLSSSTPPPGNVCVNVTSGGCTTVVCVAPGTHGFRQASGNTDPRDEQQVFAQKTKVYPNPSKGSFNITLPAIKTSAVMHMVDANGRDAGQYTLKEGDNFIPDEGLAPGIYYLVINADENVLSYKIEILK